MALTLTDADRRPNSPYEGSTTIVTSDVADNPFAWSALYVGGAGDVKVKMLDGSTPTFKAVPVGTTLNIQFVRVFTTGTAATLMVGLWRSA